MMDIPFVRFSFPILILYLFYWAVSIEPYIPETADEETKATLSLKETRRLLAEARELQIAAKFPDAIVPLSKLHEMYPENHLYIQQLAEVHHHLEDYVEEAKMWEQFLTYAPMPIEGCPQIGRSYLSQGLSKEATRAFERCLALDERQSDSLFFYAQALEKEGNYERAAELYRRGLRISPEYSDLIVGLARVQFRQGELTKSREAVLGVLRKNPDNVDALLAAGMIAWGRGELAQAKAYLERGRRISPGYQDFSIILDRVLRQERQRSKSSAKSSHARAGL